MKALKYLDKVKLFSKYSDTEYEIGTIKRVYFSPSPHFILRYDILTNNGEYVIVEPKFRKVRIL